MKRWYLIDLLVLLLFMAGVVVLFKGMQTSQSAVESTGSAALPDVQMHQPNPVSSGLQSRTVAQTALASVNGLEVVDPEPECGRTFTVHVNVTNQSGTTALPGTVTLENIHRGTGATNYMATQNYPAIPPNGNYVVPVQVTISSYVSRGQQLYAGTNGSSFSTKYDIQQGNCSKTSGSPSIPYYELQVRHSQKCLDVKADDFTNGTPIQQYSCHGSANQKWRLESVGDGYYQIISQRSGKCIDVKAATDGDQTPVQLYDCHHGDNQKFRLQRVDGDYYLLIARHSGRCLDVRGLGQEDGAPVQQYQCNYGTNQQWRLR